MKTRTLARWSGLVLLWFATWVTASYHAGSVSKPAGLDPEAPNPARAVWVPKEKFGMNHLVLEGNAFDRGRKAGELTKHLLMAQEKELVGQLGKWVPNDLILQGLIVLGANYFRGVDSYFEPWAKSEMYGVSLSAPREFDYLADGYTRQLAYHGLHEVGQMMVDQGGEDMGCTVAAVPFGDSWIVGRNFDFEGGQIFDSEKIVKWVFPDEGNAYVSVIWAGMVGAVTGVNDKGLYVSINAAGSSDYRRIGTPSTLVLLKVLQFAKSVDAALEIFRNETMFITDIFVLVDAESGKAFRIEKSPERTEIIELENPTIITNHLVAPAFENDSINVFRKTELTSMVRQKRGESLLEKLKPERAGTNREAELSILEILRDKGEADDKPLPLGNRRAIDAMIATHSVIYNAKDRIFFVSQGPGVSGSFTGFDLARSFRGKAPVEYGRLPRDPLVSDEGFSGIRNSAKAVSRARSLLNKGRCADAQAELERAAGFPELSLYQQTLGDLYMCQGQKERARSAWKRALELHPAYLREVRSLEEKLSK